MNYRQYSWTKLLLQILISLFVMPLDSHAEETQMLDMDLKSLMEMQITSAGRKEQNLADVPAAVYVIHQEDIQNSGATSIPEVLRMVPGLQVARISSSKWAISSRGFNSTFANKLLVQIDGRTVYTPAYSGVYWDVQNVVLEDVERIEIIRGPGATMWGANAVNGIINIITKQSSDTQGNLISAGTGNHETVMAAYRYGTQFNKNTYGRFYAGRHDRDSFKFEQDGTDANDDWQMTNGGFRLDGDVGLNDSWTFQGDLYHGDNNQRVDSFWMSTPPYHTQVQDKMNTNGANLLARWQRKLSNKSSFNLQFYYDFTNRDEIYLEEKNDIFDIDFQYHFQMNNWNDIVCGLGYRLHNDDFDNSYQIQMTPDSRRDELFSAFIQDEISLIKNCLWLTSGSKIEHNYYTGFEIQPNLRLLWKPTAKHNLWTSVAHAVRTPSRIEDSGKIITALIPEPVFQEIAVYGRSNFDSEQLTAWEAGYRYIPAKNLAFDIALHYDAFEDLQSYSQESFFAPIYFANSMYGNSHGVEIMAVLSPIDWIEIELSYSYIELEMTQDGDTNFYTEKLIEGSSPINQFFIKNNIKLSKNITLNIWGSYTDKLAATSLTAARNNITIDDYFNLDANLQWRFKKGMVITLAGQSLLDNRHLEFIQESFTSPIEIERSIYTKLTYNF
ncbi:MAG: TonB-dependent receptor plug domain-containing protein [Desulfamplus sp.]|nr:TonB-dependent receptor plug domain-containing protein [Desulfamplus sp.]